MVNESNLYKPMTMTPKKDRLNQSLQRPKQRYINDGNPTITLDPYDKPPFKEPLIKPSEGYCTMCDQWKNGNGTDNCLECDKYKVYKKKTTIRNAFAFKHIPQEMVEAFADTKQTKEIKDVLAKLPLERAVPFMMQYFMGCSLQEIADYHTTDKSKWNRKNKSTVEMIKEMLKK